MSWTDIDYMPRMTDYLKPDDLDTEACLKLVEQVLGEQMTEYIQVKRALLAKPGNKDLIGHLKTLQQFYMSDYFKNLTCGLVDGKDVMKKLDERALAGRRSVPCAAVI